jgi:hypothetical protein
VLLMPAVAPEPHDERTRGILENKRHNVAVAEQSLKQARTTWMMDTVHDIPLQRPVELTQAIKTWWNNTEKQP